MAEETHLAEPAKVSRKRNIGKKKGSKGNKKPRTHGMGETNKPKKIDKKMKKLFRKRAREYNSDDDDDDDVDEDEKRVPVIRDGHEMKGNGGESSRGGEEEEEEEEEEEKEEEAAEGEDVNLDNGVSDDEEDSEIQPGITKFTEGCRGFSIAFKNIINKSVPDDSLGPVLSAHKNLVASKLAEEEDERKVKGEAKKEKHLVHEKGHVKPTKHLDSHEKFLIGVATKGVVKLFNAVNKAQNAQKGLNPSRSKDVKAIRKRRKDAFFSELSKTSIPAVNTSAKAQTSTVPVDGEGPSWAPLRDNYMLTNSKLKDWDKMPDTTVADDIGRMSEDSSSDDD